MNRDLSYEEKGSHLDTRIQAHLKYANFTLEDWFDYNLEIPKGGKLLELGCGNGNWFDLWARKLGSTGSIIAVDASQELISQASERFTNCSSLTLHMDFNDLRIFTDDSFDIILCPFSIYYAEDARKTLTDIKRILKKSASLYLMGPTLNNAEELYMINQRVFGFKSEDRSALRIARVQAEFLPISTEIFDIVEETIIPRKITFPSVDEYIRYYQATLLFGEACEKAGNKPSFEQIKNAGLETLELSKEITFIKITK